MSCTCSMPFTVSWSDARAFINTVVFGVETFVAGSGVSD